MAIATLTKRTDPLASSYRKIAAITVASMKWKKTDLLLISFCKINVLYCKNFVLRLVLRKKASILEREEIFVQSSISG